MSIINILLVIVLVVIISDLVNTVISSLPGGNYYNIDFSIINYITKRSEAFNKKKLLLILLINSGLFTAVFLKFNGNIQIIKCILLITILIITSFTDMESMDIHVEINIAGALAAVVLNLLMQVDILDMLLGLLIGFLPMFILSFLGAMGEGDAYLLGMIGVFLGWRLTLLSLFLSVVIGGVVAAILLLAFKYDRKSHIAFGPYICIATIIAMFFGQRIINWYLGYLGFSV